MENGEVLLIVTAMAIVTAVPRVLPVGFLARRNLPEWLVTWLRYVPISVLSAMLVLDLFWRENGVEISPRANPMLPAAALGFLVAMRTRNLFATVSAGMGALALLRLYLSA
jgi:branched-subunit amino acid transport protein